MGLNRRHIHSGSSAAVVAAAALAGACPAQSPQVLVFSRTAGFRHDSIPAGIAMMQRIGQAECLGVVATEDPSVFTPASLASFRAVVFLCTTGDVLNPSQQGAFEAYMAAGGGWLGIHSATDTEYNWPYYSQLIGGAYFADHPVPQQASIRVEHPTDLSTRHLADPWVRFDEWYNFRQNPRPDVCVLLRLDESTYSGGTMGDHPIAWKRELGAGRAWYTAGGHTIASYTEPAFETHIRGGLLWAMRLECPADFNRDGDVSVQDLFDFLAAYFAGDLAADLTRNDALSVEDLFTFLREYFTPCT